MSQGSRITDEQIETIRATYTLTGKFADAAKAAGVSISTARRYVTETDNFEELRAEKKAQTIEHVIVKCGEAQEKLLAAMVDDAKLSKSSLQEIATAFGIVTDKRQLLSGQATDRREHVAADALARLTPEEREQAARIREKLAREAAV